MNFQTLLDWHLILGVLQIPGSTQIRLGNYHISMDFLHWWDLHHQGSLRLFPMGMSLTPVLVSAEDQAQCNLGEHLDSVLLGLIPCLD
jgi:hypothetical protein